MLISFVMESHFRRPECELRCLAYHSNTRRMCFSYPAYKVPCHEWVERLWLTMNMSQGRDGLQTLRRGLLLSHYACSFFFSSPASTFFHLFYVVDIQG